MQNPTSRTTACSKDHGAVDVSDQQRPQTGGTALPRIARVFGMSPDAFLRTVISGKDVPAALSSTVQASALLNAFMRITDPGARERCLEYVREAAAREVGQAA
jgi:hypothetical protein